VESCGFGQLHVVLFRENHISGAGESGEVGNPGTLLMTKRRVGVSSGNWFEESQVSKARPGAPLDFTLDIAESTCFVISLPTRFSEPAARDDKGKGRG
jgi:hypothetical protein